jgi:hypothetical protein
MGQMRWHPTLAIGTKRHFRQALLIKYAGLYGIH